MGRISYYYAYIALSNMVMVLFAVDAALTFRQLFPTMVFLTSSRAFSIMCMNAIAANILLLGTCVRKGFFGTLSPVERQKINEEFFVQVFESTVGLTYFQHMMTTETTIAFALVGAFKLFHLLAVSRLESIERSAQRPVGSIRRLAAFNMLALVVDIYYMVGCASHIFEKGVNIYLMMLLNFCVMSLTALVTQLKLLLFLNDNGQEAVGPARFYVEILSSVVGSVLYVSFFALMTRVALPLHMIRDLLRSLKNVTVALRSFAKYRKLAANIDKTFPDALPADLDRDRNCAVCYDDMLDDTHCKRLSCGHCYHRHCLRKWFERNSTCPYCRKEIDETNAYASPVRVPHAPAPAAAMAAPPPAEVQANQPSESVSVSNDNGNMAEAAPLGGANALPADEISDADVREAYLQYIKMMSEDPSAAPVRPHPTGAASNRTELGEEATSDVELLRAQLVAYQEYRQEVEAANQRLQEKLVRAELRLMMSIR